MRRWKYNTYNMRRSQDYSLPKSISTPSMINNDAPQYFMISGFMYLPSVAPIITETAVMTMYAQTEPINTASGFADFEAMPIPTICVLSAISAKNTAVKVATNIFQSINSPKFCETKFDPESAKVLRRTRDFCL